MSDLEEVLLALLIVVVVWATLMLWCLAKINRINRDAYRDAMDGWQRTLDKWRDSQAETFTAWQESNEETFAAWMVCNEQMSDRLRLLATENEMLRERAS